MIKQLKNIFTGIALITLFIYPTNVLFAQTNSDEESISELTTEEITRLNNNRKLVADKADTRTETAAIDSIRMLFELNEEANELSPADDLYDGMWNNQYVKAYSGITIPDVHLIDLSSFTMPIEGRITSPFGPRGRRFHYGTDLKLQTGDTVYAAFEGRVRVKQYEKKGYGYYLVLRHPNGLETVYGHLSKFLVVVDENVEAGQPIALGGSTGRSTGPHLHFECRFLGQAIDPADIVDFNNFCTYEEQYIFEKSKVNNISVNNSNKYTAQNSSVTYYRIRSGDTLSGIAKKYRVSVAQLCRLNGIKTTTTLKVGRVLRCS